MSKLITEEYKKLLQKEHEPGVWGQTAKTMIPDIVKYAELTGTKTILDYGAGHGGLRKALEKLYPNQYTVIEYEPGRPEAAATPSPNDYVACIDVLEHIEPELIDNVLDDLQRVVLKAGYFTISCRPAGKILKDGRNAHLIVETQNWWKNKLAARFNIVDEEWDARDKNYRVHVSKL